MENLIHDLFKPLITFHICYSYLFVISLFENFLSYYLQVNEFTFGCSSLNLRLMLSAASVCYIIILHGLWSKFLLEDNPVNSFNCYMNLKKENKKQMWRKKLDVMMRCMKLALFILFHATFYFCLLVFHLP